MDGLRYYDAKNNVFRKIGHQLLDHVFIYSLFEDSKHRLWAATTSYGLFCIDHGKVIRYSKESHCGLTDNYIIVVFEDSQKRIWIGTNNCGMFCLNANDKQKIKHASCGLPQECTICSIVEDANILRLVRNRQEKIVEGGKEAIEANKTLTQLDKDFVKSISDMVEVNLENANFSIDDITSSMGISRSLLYTKMKSLMNISMGDYIRHKRIERACHMLSEGYNVSETAYACGFSDPNYFSKVFKKMKGMAPSDYS